jgi:hypothetical protein
MTCALVRLSASKHAGMILLAIRIKRTPVLQLKGRLTHVGYQRSKQRTRDQSFAVARVNAAPLASNSPSCCAATGHHDWDATVCRFARDAYNVQCRVDS